MNLPDQTDVLLVGLGPVGAALANLLGQYGVSVLAIDKATEIFRAPRAIALDNEALRVLQMCGLHDGDIDTIAIPEVRMHSPHFGFYSRANTAGAVDGHPKLVTFYQPQLEEVLRTRLKAYEHVQVALGASLSGFEQDASGVRAQIKDAGGVQHEVRASYIVGADGANSLVRSLLGLDFKGKTYAEDWLVVDARRLPQAIDHVEFICDPRRPTPHMVAPGDRQRWEFKLQPGETREEMERPETVRRLLAPWAQGQEIDIERVAVYRFHARVADTFQVERAFLVGDAAHITPPFVGQGLVAGLRDVANLGWKLAWVIQGRAQPALLQTYSRERQPHAREMIQLAQWMGRLVMPGNAVQAWLTHGLMKTMSAIPRLRNLFENLEIKPANRFKTGCFTPGKTCAGLIRGGQLPQGWVRSLTDREHILSDDALGQGLMLVGFGVDPAASLPQAVRQKWRQAGGQFMRIAPRGQPAHQASVPTWEDLDNSFGSHKVPSGWVAVVRPDRVIMADGPLASAMQLAQQSLAMLHTA
ncbi:MAG TPA: bifunctional 3-(3-hydroxy-phenyl)propionate/3-hydroxycinnamic acid hydroxylase [Aquabacterium sp.]|uniref:bifunctional 3-(3-hydroxy-phenyl)propionate/3-hydroxycinnamic acid hydroxylase n=1 Tax=Aquabacterium sp. TaxID=1872578 RepID=UPI002E345E4A|nr:bifunctional 3-(3-hydroxy-phenyl)propionate/3-hydroxycinnamic acid hydroxylase [Aquabacterium sp.]HEX5357165.1 bifunctional 3-(3-hydroxy-phenyl)propionate/3-hydroxycinnamic acid hydroxylase [Aquabacterium sp.]